MTTKTETGELVRVGSHWVELGSSYHWGKVAKEEVYLTFATTWRGQEATVQIRCDRYAGGMDQRNLTLGAWRTVAQEARGKADEAGRFGPNLTETARQRLGQAHYAAAEEWLSSDDFTASHRLALLAAIDRQVKDSRSHTAEDMRKLMALNAGELTAQDQDRAQQVAAAYESLARTRDAFTRGTSVAD